MSGKSRKRRNAKRAATALALNEGLYEAQEASEPVRSTMRPVAPSLSSREEAAVKVLEVVLEKIAEPIGLPIEHREHPRVKLDVEIDLFSESQFFSGLSGDVSEGGLFVQTYRPLTIGQEIDVAFELGGRRIEARAVVKWHRARGDDVEAGFGVAFDDLSDEDRDRIHAFCAQRAPLYYEL